MRSSWRSLRVAEAARGLSTAADVAARVHGGDQSPVAALGGVRLALASSALAARIALALPPPHAAGHSATNEDGNDNNLAHVRDGGAEIARSAGLFDLKNVCICSFGGRAPTHASALEYLSNTGVCVCVI